MPTAQAQAPVFTQQPASASACSGETLMSAVEVDFATGTDVALQWRFNGTDLNDADRDGRVSITIDLTDPASATSQLTVTDADPDTDPGLYDCVASTTNNGSTASDPADWVVGPTVDPSSSADRVCVGDVAALSANPTGSGPPDQLFFWSVFSGPDTSGFQFTPFPPTIPDVMFSPNASGDYALRVETFDDTCAPNGSDSATVMIEALNALATDPQPETASACVGTLVALTAQPAGGDGDYLFLWEIVTEPPGSVSTFDPDDEAEDPTFTPSVIGHYELRVTLSDTGPLCPPHVSELITVDAVDQLTVDAGEDLETCLGRNVTMAVEVIPSDGALNYDWSIVSGPDLNPAQFSDPTAADPVFSPAAATAPETPYTLMVEVSGGGCVPQTDSVDVAVFSAPSIDPSVDSETVCVDHASNLSAGATGSDDQSFLWTILSGPDLSFTQFSSPSVENPTFTPSEEGTYNIQVEFVDTTCDVADSKTLLIDALPSLTAAPTPEESTACVLTAVQLAANPAGGSDEYTFMWTVTDAPVGGMNDPFAPSGTVEEPTFTPSQFGTYVLEVVVGADGCNDTDAESVTLNVTDALNVVATATESEVCLTEFTIVQAEVGEGDAAYTWSVLDGPDLSSSQFSDPQAPITLFTPSAPGEYMLSVDAVSGECPPSSDLLPLTVHDELTAVATADQPTMCRQESTGLNVVAGGSGTQNQLIQWTITDGPNLDPSQIDDDTSDSPTFTPLSVTGEGLPYVIDVQVIDPACVTQLVTDEVSITVNDWVAASPQADPEATCAGIAVDLSANATGGDESYDYTWSVASGPSNDPAQFDDTTAELPVFTPDSAPGTYILALVVEDGECQAAAESFLDLPVSVSLSIDPQADIVDGEDNIAVLGEATTLHANMLGGDDPQITWSVADLPAGCPADDPLSDPNVTDPTFTAACEGTYRLTVVADDDICGIASAFMDIDVVLFAIAPSAVSPSLCLGLPGSDATVLLPNLNDAASEFTFDFTWTLLQGPDLNPSQLDTTDPAMPVLTPLAVGTYVIQVDADETGGTLPTLTGQVTVGVSDEGPTIDDQPADEASVCVSESTTLSVTASGTDLSYQWQQDGIDIPAATSSSFTLHNAEFADAGAYTCNVSNGCDFVISGATELTVDPPITETLLIAAREDDLLRQATITGCTISGDLLDRDDMGAGVQRVTGLAVHPTDGTVYAAVRTLTPDSAETHLATIDLGTGIATLIQPSMGEPISDLAFDPSGTLHAIRGNDGCPTCPGSGLPGEVFTVDLNSATLTPLDPPLVFGLLEGHTITFDAKGDLYHHGLEPQVSSRLVRVDLDTRVEEELRDFGTEISLTALTIHDDLMIAARRFSPSELWSLDHEGETYAETVLGQIDPETGNNITVFALAFVCGDTPPGDANCDGDIDLDDYAACYNPNGLPSPGPACQSLDSDGDGDIDLIDWAAFQTAFTGSP